ncbi:hypothetical protein O6H91_Y253500 [Diphasiastrum complanatum]|nr:hypothetical protein O6H91_Y253500 [Diphasiastrum complanatum]
MHFSLTQQISQGTAILWFFLGVLSFIAAILPCFFCSLTPSDCSGWISHITGIDFPQGSCFCCFSGPKYYKRRPEIIVWLFKARKCIFMLLQGRRDFMPQCISKS